MNQRLLLDSHPLVVLPELAVLIGLNEAIVLQQIHYWLQKSSNIEDGRPWVYNSYPEWQLQFPWWSVNTVQRTFLALVERGLLICEQRSPRPTDRRNWYSIDYVKLDLLMANGPPPQNEVMGIPSCNSACPPPQNEVVGSPQNEVVITSKWCVVNTETPAETTSETPALFPAETADKEVKTNAKKKGSKAISLSSPVADLIGRSVKPGEPAESLIEALWGDFLRHYPSRGASAGLGKAEGRKSFYRRIYLDGIDARSLVRAAISFSSRCKMQQGRKEPIYGTPMVPMISSWLNAARFEDESGPEPVPGTKTAEDLIREALE